MRPVHVEVPRGRVRLKRRKQPAASAVIACRREDGAPSPQTGVPEPMGADEVAAREEVEVGLRSGGRINGLYQYQTERCYKTWRSGRNAPEQILSGTSGSVSTGSSLRQVESISLLQI